MREMWSAFLLNFLALACYPLGTYSFRLPRPGKCVGLFRSSVGGIHSNIDDRDLIIDLQTTKALNIGKDSSDFIAYDSVYNDENFDEVNVALDTPISRVLDVAFNPLALVLTLYFAILGLNKFADILRKIMSMFGNRREEEGVQAEDLPLQVFECEVCQMQLRPAKGRAEKILGRERFRCSRCGAKASSYFNIDDMSDPRAVERLERFKREEEEDDYLTDLMDDDDDDDNDGKIDGKDD